MMRFATLSLAFVLAASASQAQITIGQAEMPHANDQLVRVQAVTNPFIDFATTGPAHSWDFSNLQANTDDTTNYQTVASTNFVYAIVYADIFFNPNRANVAKPGTDIAFSGLLPITNPYTFYYRSSSTYRAVGYGVELSGIPLPIIFNDPDEIYALPLDYGNTSTSHSSYDLTIPGLGNYNFSQDRVNEVDGWGGITTPGGVFDVLRVKTTLNMRDSISGFAIDRPVVHEYKWLTQGLRVPVLQINTTTFFGLEVVTAIYYYDVPRSIVVVEPLATTICPGANIDVHYETTGAFNAGGFFVPANHFTAQLSDASGSFAAPVAIGDVIATGSGTITATIPPGTPFGTGYRIRVISTSPDFIGTPDLFDITIGGTTVASITADGSPLICTGDTVTLTAVGGPSYQWQLDGMDIGGATDATYDVTAAGTYTVVVNNACGTATSNDIIVEVNERPIQSVDATSYLICEGDSVEIIAHDESGQSPLTYQWFLNSAPIAGETDSVVSAMLGGIYTVEVTNGTGCTFTTEDVLVSIDLVPEPGVAADGPIAFCEGGAVTLSTTAVPGNTYQWYLDGGLIPGETNSELLANASGDYTLLATNANGCSSQASTAITVTVNALPATPVVSADGATSFCDGGSVQLSVPLTPGYSYQWYMDGTPIVGATDSSLVATDAGDYNLVVTSADACASPASVTTTVTVFDLPVTPGITTSEPTTFCEGGGVTLIADEIPDVTYQWYQDGVAIGGATAMQLSVSDAGSYTVIVTTSDGCTATSDPVDVVVNPLPAVPVITASADTLYASGTGTFQWYLYGVEIPGATGSWYQTFTSGDYTVTVTDANGCSSTSEIYTYISTGIVGDAVGMEIQIFPNPSSGSFTITWPGASGGLYEITDAAGRVVMKGILDGPRTDLDMPGHVAGLYFLRVTDQGVVRAARIVRD